MSIKSFEFSDSVVKMNFELQIDAVPSHSGRAPLDWNIFDCDKEEFFKCLFGGKYPFGFGDFPQLSVEFFDGVSCVDESSDLSSELKHSAKPLPISPLVCHCWGVFFAPFFLQFLQSYQRSGLIPNIPNAFTNETSISLSALSTWPPVAITRSKESESIKRLFTKN